MPIPIDPNQDIEALAEAQLQEELRSLFVIDTEYYLQRYSQISQSLQTQSWNTDIQELYRCIHTIKGGAVTVGYEAVLQVATALEDLLSHLRYLELAPPLTDAHLSQALLEAGELLSVTNEYQQADTKPLINRIQVLHQEIQERYLPLWDENSQLHQEFAEQGLDMVVLELEIALEQLPTQDIVPDSTLQIAQHTLKQLEQIGDELKFATGWTELLQQGQGLFNYLESVIWQSHWLLFFQALKKCAKQSGNPICFEFPSFEVFKRNPPSLDGVSTEPQQTQTIIQQGLDEFSQLDALAEIGAFLDAIDLDENATPQVDFLEVSAPLMNVELESSVNQLNNSEQVEAFLEPDHLAELFVEFSQQEWLQNSLEDIDQPPVTLIEAQAAVEAPVVMEKPLQPEPLSRMLKSVQIPVPLEKLDQSAQYLVETILTLRSTQGSYQELQNQIAQLVNLAQESVQAIAKLRQVQDDYVLLDQQSNNTQTASTGPAPERYRQGYAIINRLLETNLRLSEIGAETGKTSQQVAQFLRNVDHNVLKLQNTIEDSRLVPFQNVSVRAKAILRELTIRYGKSAQLVVLGEQTQLDVNTARDLEPALLHLIRNAYDHGLESLAERVAQGKPEQGKITLSLQRQGNLFQFELRDDGRGIDSQAVQARAQALGLPLISTQTPAEILAVICQPGFSSQSQVSEISGRGIGMDVVATQVAQLGGRLTLETAPGGTTFQLKIPVPRLLVSCVLLRSGDATCAIPVDGIKTINLLGNLDVSPVTDADQAFSGMINDETGSRPALDLLKYWQPQIGDHSFADTTVCLYVYGEDNQQDFWLLADELLEQSDILINPLPQPLIAPNGLIGVSLRANGTLFPVLEAGKLVERILSSQAVEAATISSSDADVANSTNLVRSILIVDDAVLMRRRLEASLNTYGYLTHTCANGQDAWDWLQTHPQPNLVITDIEMPKLDGFTLIDRCRQGGITIPILVISSRLSEDWFDEARRLGANDYLTKGFATVDLIKKVQVLLSSGAISP